MTMDANHLLLETGPDFKTSKVCLGIRFVICLNRRPLEMTGERGKRKNTKGKSRAVGICFFQLHQRGCRLPGGGGAQAAGVAVGRKALVSKVRLHGLAAAIFKDKNR